MGVLPQPSAGSGRDPPLPTETQVRASMVSSLSSDSEQTETNIPPAVLADNFPDVRQQQQWDEHISRADPASEPMLASDGDQTPPGLAKQKTEHHIEPVERSPTKVSLAQGLKKNLGVTILNAQGKAKPEQPKVAIEKNRLIALSGLLVHLVPVGGCVALLYLNFYGYYVGSEMEGYINQDSAKENALQFVAKMHEITMMSSLTVIIFTMLRRKLVSDTQVPLGALFSGFEFANVQYLWSRELWASFTPMAKACGWLYIFSLILATIIAPLIGPASALLMIPRIDDWPAGGTGFYLNATKDEIWPGTVSGNDVPDFCNALSQPGTYEERGCPAGGWEAIKSGYAGLAISDEEGVVGDLSSRFFSGGGPFPIPGKVGLTNMIVSFRTTVTQLCISDVLLRVAQMWSTASDSRRQVPGKSFKFRKEAKFFIEDGVLQPWTGVRCEPVSVPHNATEMTIRMIPLVFGMEQSLTFSIEPGLLQTKYPTVNFMDSVPDIQASSAAVVVLPRAAFPDRDDNLVDVVANATTVMGCSISSHWIESKPYLSNLRVYQRSWSTSTEIEWDDHSNVDAEVAATPISIQTDWANYLNPSVDAEEGTVFKELVYASRATGTFSDNALIERLLAAMVTNGLARVGYSAFAQGVLPDLSRADWAEPIFPKGTFGTGGNIWNTDDIDTSNMLRAEVKVTVNGYGFWIESRTVIAAAALLIIYCCFTLPHAIFVALSGVSYMSWDNLTDLTTLAIQSAKTGTLVNTSAGVAGSKVYKTPVKLRAVGDQVEILFEDTERDHELIKPGVAYS